MEKLSLLLRQRKMLNILLHRDDLITGASLARMLDITTRTVRSDVAVINRSLEPYQARIESVRSKGYRFQAGDPSVIKTLMQADTELLTQEGRLRYLAFQLCLADEPLGIYDLEDEMFVSTKRIIDELGFYSSFTSIKPFYSLCSFHLFRRSEPERHGEI